MLNKNQVIFKMEHLKKMLFKWTGLDSQPIAVAGTAMVIHGLRPLTSDVDVAVEREVFQRLLKCDEAKGWETIVVDGRTIINTDDGFGISVLENVKHMEVGGVKVTTPFATMMFKLELYNQPNRSEAKRAQDLADYELLKPLAVAEASSGTAGLSGLETSLLQDLVDDIHARFKKIPLNSDWCKMVLANPAAQIIFSAQVRERIRRETLPIIPTEIGTTMIKHLIGNNYEAANAIMRGVSGAHSVRDEDAHKCAIWVRARDVLIKRDRTNCIAQMHRQLFASSGLNLLVLALKINGVSDEDIAYVKDSGCDLYAI